MVEVILHSWYIPFRHSAGGKTMSRYCPVTGKGPVSGNARSHSLRATRRRWNVNLQKRKVKIDGKTVVIKMSNRAYRTLNKTVKAAEAE